MRILFNLTPYRENWGRIAILPEKPKCRVVQCANYRSFLDVR